ncbi:hypothetical protein ARALYDRAFT_904750 [Arabidopsis lyrata subsp. lyrata]|uniref:Uncharacterized protein n=1 Tax=Arabidopsis lyrata subsp. lyrata TaxID=81972 RepID=D7LQU9_ARALL|nr:hypothetical protein ARALYDRAFT_904750 [Arabidopsis lyrata subsp. lyrata]
MAIFYQNTLTQYFHIRRPHRFLCKSMTKTTPDASSADLRRRSSNYQPSRDVLKKKVKMMLDVVKKSRLEQLELMDDLQKLFSYHFELQINDDIFSS